MAGLGKRHLILKGRTWWFHRDVPAALRAAFDGRKTITRNLHTSDLRVAQQRRAAVLFETEKLFGDAAGGAKVGPLAELMEEARLWAEERKLYDEDPVAWAERVTGKTLNGGEEHEAPAFVEALEERAEAIRERHGQDAFDVFGSIVRGDDAILSHLDDHLRSANLPQRTAQERRTAVTRFAEWRPKLTLARVTRRVAGEYVDALERAGVNPATGNKALSNLRVYWRWMGKRGVMDKADNPWAGQNMEVRRAAHSADEREFTEEEMRTLLYAPYPSGWDHEERLHDAMRVAALSGMRIDEICRLTVADCQGGLFNIRFAKTKAGVRKVPIHSDLKSIIRRRTKGKDPTAFLFHDVIKRGESGERSMPLGKQFGRYRKAVGVDEKGAEGQRRSLVNFHSFRRWFITMAEKAGQPPHLISTVAGHERPGMALGVYSGGPSERQMRAVVEAVRLPK